MAWISVLSKFFLSYILERWKIQQSMEKKIKIFDNTSPRNSNSQYFSAFSIVYTCLKMILMAKYELDIPELILITPFIVGHFISSFPCFSCKYFCIIKIHLYLTYVSNIFHTYLESFNKYYLNLNKMYFSVIDSRKWDSWIPGYEQFSFCYMVWNRFPKFTQSLATCTSFYKANRCGLSV